MKYSKIEFLEQENTQVETQESMNDSNKREPTLNKLSKRIKNIFRNDKGGEIYHEEITVVYLYSPNI